MKHAAASLFTLLCLAATSADARPGDPVQQSVEAIVDRFEGAYRGCGLIPPFSAEVEIRAHPGLISYANATRTVTVSRYEDLPPPLHQQMEAWAGAMVLADGSALFEAIFQRLGTAHEMGHWQLHISRRFLDLDRWETEIEANRIAIAFWSMDAGDAETLTTNVEGWLALMGALPDPVPEGQEPRAYFQNNYSAILADPAAYGWFQGEFLRQAWARRDEATFCDLARIDAPAPVEAFADD